jgi:beta-mannosidase
MTRRVLELDGAHWWLGQAATNAQSECATWDEIERVTEWLPATVPGNIHADLVRAGRLPDLMFGTQIQAAQWVDDYSWWLLRECPLPTSPGERVHLVLRGVDYISDVFFNGHLLGRHEGMFSPQVYELTELLSDQNQLAVRLLGARWLPRDRSSGWIRLLNSVESQVSSLSPDFPQRRDTLKCQMSFGWDFSPALRTLGLWDDVYAVASGGVFIQDVTLRQQWTGGEAHLTIEVEIDARQAHAIQLSGSLAGETFEAAPIMVEKPLGLAAGRCRHVLELSVPQPHLWWPWDHGAPDLYRLTVQVREGDQLLDSVVQAIGLRQVELDGWSLRVNGQRVYARGANWVPADILPGRVTESDYRALLLLARQANMNLLRVWGGGLREKRTFYELCDRLGILVWQEFPLACAFLTRFPSSQAYLRLVEEETRAIVRDLRNHPSVVLWCGGNEFNPRRNACLVSTLRRVTSEEDPGRPFLPASPANGDSHYWQVWHQLHPASAYRDDRARFASEFGLQAPPEATTLERFIPPEELWPPGPSWTYHGAGLEKLWRYARPFLQGRETTLDEFVEASQRAQAYGLRVAIEHYRRRKAHGVGGALVWQLNEPWPAISWAIIDHYGQPKPAFELVKRLFSPVLISLDYPLKCYRAGNDLAFDVWIINDRQEALEACQVEVVLWDDAGRAANRFTHRMDMAADSAEPVGHACWPLPPGDGWRLTCTVFHEGQALSTNEYDLSLYDGIRPTWRQRLWTWSSKLVTPS